MMALEKARCPSSPAGAQRRSGESRRGRGGSETVRLKTVRKIEKARSGWARVRETETRFFPLWHRGAEMDLEVTDQNKKPASLCRKTGFFRVMGLRLGSRVSTPRAFSLR